MEKQMKNIIGTNYEEWVRLTGLVSTNTSNISELSELTFSSTTVTPFTSFNESISSFNTAIGNLKAFTTTDVTNMDTAASNKAYDDKKQADA
jgi:hypothetical protein